MLSDIYKAFIPKDEIKTTLQCFTDLHPIGRIGSANDIADAIEFLLSEKASRITGTVVDVNGSVMAGSN